MHMKNVGLWISVSRNIRYIWLARRRCNLQIHLNYKYTNSLQGRMIKITPLSGLVTADNSETDHSKSGEGKQDSKMECEDSSSPRRLYQIPDEQVDEGVFFSPDSCNIWNPDISSRSNRIVGESKGSVIPNDLLLRVTNMVKTQVDDGSFRNPEFFEPESNVLLNMCKDKLPDRLSNSESLSDKDDIGNHWTQVQRKSAKKSARKRKKESLDEDDVKADDSKKRHKKIMPNYFIAIQITNPKIHHGLLKVQQKVEEQKPSLAAAMIPLPTLHMTLLVMHLSNEEDIERAKTVLKHCGDKLKSTLDNPITVDISGIGNFGNNVVFAKVNKDQNLQKLHYIADSVVDTFRESEVNLAGEKGFKPHITIMKLSRSPKLRKKGIKKIDSNYYSDYVDENFGSQTLQSLQLCSMLAPKDKKGYYQVLCSVPLYKQPKNVFMVDKEKEIRWNYTPAPAPEPLEPTEEEKKNFVSSIRPSQVPEKEKCRFLKTRVTKQADSKSVSRVTHRESGLPGVMKKSR